MKIRHAFAATAALTALSVFALTGCGNDEKPVDDDTETAEETEEATPEVTESEEGEETEEAAGPSVDLPGDVTAPGTSLAIGETALIVWDHYEHGDIQLGVTVTDIREGSISDFDGIGLDDETAAQIADYTPYYIDASVVKANLDDPEIAFNSVSEQFKAVTAGGDDLPQFSIFGDFELCNQGSLEPEVDEGEPQLTCVIYMVPAGEEFGAAQWQQFDTPYDMYQGSPVSWS